MAKRKRDIQLKFRVTPQEREMIETKMAQFGTTNMAAYLRKMAIDGYVVKLNLPELRELVSLLRYSSNNLNQLTRRAHETGRIYEADLEDIQLKFRVTPQEREMIETKMAQFGTTNMAAYLRKMAIDGYVVKLDLPELRELVSLLRYSSNNLNQFTRRAHETGRIYETDLEDIQQSQERIWTAAEKIVSSLAALK